MKRYWLKKKKHHKVNKAQYKCVPNPNDKSSFFVVKVSSTQEAIYDGTDLDVYELARQLRKTWKYSSWRQKVFKAKGRICEKCGCEHSLDVHHRPRLIDLLKNCGLTKLSQALNRSCLWEVKKGFVLCVECHSKEHPELKGKYFEARIEKQAQLDNAMLILQ
jgi:hypothetical protein